MIKKCLVQYNCCDKQFCKLFTFFPTVLTRSSVVAETARRFVSLNILRSHSRSLKVIRNDTVECSVSLLVPIIIPIPFKLSVSRTVSEIFSVKEWYDLATEGRSRSRSLKMSPFDRSYTTFIGRPL